MKKIYGHRGSKGYYPENTLLSFRRAIDEGAEGIELDIHMTKDGEIVVIHDETLNRTTTGTGWVTDYHLQEIKQFSAGAKYASWERYEKSWDFQTVPTLQEVLQLLEGHNVELNIELKTYSVQYPGIEEKVLAVVKDSDYRQKIVYSSFHLPTLLRIKQLDKTANIAWLLEQPIPYPEDYVESLGLESLHVDKNVILANPNAWRHLHKQIRVWTANDEEEIKQLLDLNVEAIITDFPERALELREQNSAVVEKEITVIS